MIAKIIIGLGMFWIIIALIKFGLQLLDWFNHWRARRAAFLYWQDHRDMYPQSQMYFEEPRVHEKINWRQEGF